MNDTSKPRIMILCGDDAHHKYLVSRLSISQNVVLAIVERSVGTLKRLSMARKYKPLCNQLYQRARRAISGTARYRRKYFSLEGLPESTVPILEVDSINDSIVPLFIRSYTPDIIIVMGTSILKGHILIEAKDIPVINIHGGCLPDYKGNHCFFFALLNEDFSKIASTIHLIDSGVDSGSIICRIHPSIYRSDDAEKLYCRAEKEAIQELDNLINKYGANIASLASPQQACGHIYLSKDRTIACEAKMHQVLQKIKENGQETLSEQHIDYFYTKEKGDPYG